MCIVDYVGIYVVFCSGWCKMDVGKNMVLFVDCDLVVYWGIVLIEFYVICLG